MDQGHWDLNNRRLGIRHRRNPDSETGDLFAPKAKSSLYRRLNLTADHRRIMGVAFNHRSGFTLRTVERVTGIRAQTASPRLLELREAGKLQLRHVAGKDKFGRTCPVPEKHGRFKIHILGPHAAEEDLRG